MRNTIRRLKIRFLMWRLKRSIWKSDAAIDDKLDAASDLAMCQEYLLEDVRYG